MIRTDNIVTNHTCANVTVNNNEVVQNCQLCFEFRSPSVLWAERTKKFEARYVACDRMFIHWSLHGLALSNVCVVTL